MLAAAHFLNAVLMIAIPLVLGVVLARRGHLSWGIFGVGAATFIASQALHIPFNNLVLTPFVTERGMFTAGGFAFVVAALLYGLSAGVFEEVARFVVMRRWKHETQKISNALMFGAGHGGGEAIILGVLALYGFFQAVALRGVDLSATISPEKMEATAAQLAQYWDMSWYQALLGAVERVGALYFHMSASVLVLQGVRRGQMRWLLGAVTWHTLFNAVTLIAMDRWGVYAAEGLVIVGAGIGLLMIYSLKRRGAQREEIAEQSMAEDPRPSELPRIDNEDIPADRLEDSRYI